MGTRGSAAQKKITRHVVRIYEHVKTGPLYDQAVQRMITYRSLAARMGNAGHSTQAKLDRRLEKLGEQVSETLEQLTDVERMALTCWRNGIMPNTYEIDHEAITDRPYVSLRRIERTIDETDEDEQAELDRQIAAAPADTGRMKAFIDRFNADD